MNERRITALVLVVLAVLSAGCSAGELPGSEAFGTETPTPEDGPPDVYRAEGDSMEPTISDGEYVQVTHDAEPEPGDVIIFRPVDGDTSIIHRIAFHVESGENWYNKTDTQFVGQADSCGDLRMCPAPDEGFVTLGDNNSKYDQADPTDPHPPVEADRVIGVVPNR